MTLPPMARLLGQIAAAARRRRGGLCGGRQRRRDVQRRRRGLVEHPQRPHGGRGRRGGDRAAGGGSTRARSHCRVVRPLIHAMRARMQTRGNILSVLGHSISEPTMRPSPKPEIHRVDPDCIWVNPKGAYIDFQSNCWVNLRILGQPCGFYLLGDARAALQPRALRRHQRPRAAELPRVH